MEPICDVVKKDDGDIFGIRSTVPRLTNAIKTRHTNIGGTCDICTYNKRAR